MAIINILWLKQAVRFVNNLDVFELKWIVFDKVISQSLAAKAEDVLSRQRDNTLNSCLIITLLFLADMSHFLASLFIPLGRYGSFR